MILDRFKMLDLGYVVCFVALIFDFECLTDSFGLDCDLDSVVVL